MEDVHIQELLLENISLKYAGLAELLGFSRGYISEVKAGKRPISAEYKVRCVEKLHKPGFRFNIFWFEDPEKHPFWVPEDYWMHQFDSEIQVFASEHPEFHALLEKVAKLPPKRRKKWLDAAKAMFDLAD